MTTNFHQPGLTTHQQEKWRRDRDAHLLGLRELGMTYADIAKFIGITADVVRMHCRNERARRTLFSREKGKWDEWYGEVAKVVDAARSIASEPRNGLRPPE